MTNEPNASDTVQMLADHGLTLSDETEMDAAPAADLEDDELEFQPIQRTGLHWLTLTLIGLILWGAGFLVGVLVDRAMGG